MEIIDLSMPVEEGHFRWPIERGKKGDFASGSLFEASFIKTSCHGFTHMDAPSHMVPGGETLNDLDLNAVVGQAAVADISDCQPNQEITPELLEQRLTHASQNEIILFKSCWALKRDWKTPEFWRDSPWLSADACRFLKTLNPTAVAFDFPQDYSIRLLLDDVVAPIEEHVSHDILLRNGVTLIEYLIGTERITAPHVELIALPIKLPGSDGAPSRVIARQPKY